MAGLQHHRFWLLQWEVNNKVVLSRNVEQQIDQSSRLLAKARLKHHGFWLLQWEVKKEAALSRIVEQRMNKEAVEAENAANNAKLAEHLVHVSPLLTSGFQESLGPWESPPPICLSGVPSTPPGQPSCILSAGEEPAGAETVCAAQGRRPRKCPPHIWCLRVPQQL